MVASDLACDPSEAQGRDRFDSSPPLIGGDLLHSLASASRVEDSTAGFDVPRGGLRQCWSLPSAAFGQTFPESSTREPFSPKSGRPDSARRRAASLCRPTAREVAGRSHRNHKRWWRSPNPPGDSCRIQERRTAGLVERGGNFRVPFDAWTEVDDSRALAGVAPSASSSSLADAKFTLGGSSGSATPRRRAPADITVADAERVQQRLSHVRASSATSGSTGPLTPQRAAQRTPPHTPLTKVSRSAGSSTHHSRSSTPVGLRSQVGDASQLDLVEGLPYFRLPPIAKEVCEKGVDIFGASRLVPQSWSHVLTPSSFKVLNESFTAQRPLSDQLSAELSQPVREASVESPPWPSGTLVGDEASVGVATRVRAQPERSVSAHNLLNDSLSPSSRPCSRPGTRSMTSLHDVSDGRHPPMSKPGSQLGSRSATSTGDKARRRARRGSRSLSSTRNAFDGGSMLQARPGSRSLSTTRLEGPSSPTMRPLSRPGLLLVHASDVVSEDALAPASSNSLSRRSSYSTYSAGEMSDGPSASPLSERPSSMIGSRPSPTQLELQQIVTGSRSIALLSDGVESYGVEEPLSPKMRPISRPGSRLAPLPHELVEEPLSPVGRPNSRVGSRMQSVAAEIDDVASSQRPVSRPGAKFTAMPGHGDDEEKHPLSVSRPSSRLQARLQESRSPIERPSSRPGSRVTAMIPPAQEDLSPSERPVSRPGSRAVPMLDDADEPLSPKMRSASRPGSRRSPSSSEQDLSVSSSAAAARAASLGDEASATTVCDSTFQPELAEDVRSSKERLGSRQGPRSTREIPEDREMSFPANRRAAKLLRPHTRQATSRAGRRGGNEAGKHGEWKISLCQSATMHCPAALPSKDVLVQRKVPRPVSPLPTDGASERGDTTVARISAIRDVLASIALIRRDSISSRSAGSPAPDILEEISATPEAEHETAEAVVSGACPGET
eukprot:TRINITY_DN15019_c0_g2_i1.p1 TRINITY_DN15019_c0_g2~~TRINITY_DN15019_c0_g2_i1.p1  ORF type:complete len:952 (+),score=91.24 TRINITY_DN15019_c0_g2_i1:255-3110(+)